VRTNTFEPWDSAQEDCMRGIEEGIEMCDTNYNSSLSSSANENDFPLLSASEHEQALVVHEASLSTAAHGDGVLKQGWLQKCGASGIRWHRRYFRLLSDRLQWFDNDESLEARGELLLAQVGLRGHYLVTGPGVAVQGPPSSHWLRRYGSQIELETTAGQVYYLCGADEAEAHEWGEIINAVIIDVRRRIRSERIVQILFSSEDALALQHFAKYVQKTDSKMMPLVLFCMDWHRHERYVKKEESERCEELTAQIRASHLAHNSSLADILVSDEILCQAWGEMNCAAIYVRAKTLLADTVASFVASAEFSEFRAKEQTFRAALQEAQEVQ